MDSVKHLIAATHFQVEKVRDATKETSANVPCVRFKLDQVVKEAIKIANKIHPSTDAISTTISIKFSEMKNATVNTIAYFLCRFEPHE